MRWSLSVVLSLAACGSVRAPAAVEPKPAEPPPAIVDPRSSRDALIAATLRALSAGDIDALAKLEDVHCGEVDLKPDRDRDAARALRDGARVELVRIADDRNERIDATSGCTAIELHYVTIVVRVAQSPKVAVGLLALDLGGAWHLVEPPDLRIASKLGEPTGIAECDEVVASYLRVFECKMLPFATRDAMRERLAAMKASWQFRGDAERQTAASSCKDALGAIRQSAKPFGCDV